MRQPVKFNLIRYSRNIHPYSAFHCGFMGDDSGDCHIHCLYYVNGRCCVVLDCIEKITDEIELTCSVTAKSCFLRRVNVGGVYCNNSSFLGVNVLEVSAAYSVIAISAALQCSVCSIDAI